MHPRLVPINACISWCTPNDGWPSPFADAGFRLAGLEIPVRDREDETIVLDIVMWARETGWLIGGECKSGANLRGRQALRLGRVQPASLVRSASVDLASEVRLAYQPVLVCLEPHEDRILLGMRREDLSYPILVVGSASVRHAGAPFLDERLAAAWAAPLPVQGAPPGYVPLDDESSDAEFDDVVRAELVVCMARAEARITVRALTERAVRHYPLFGTRTRQRLQQRVKDAAQRIAAEQSPALRYNRDSAATEAHIEILRTPETTDPRGRTQAYQAAARWASAGLPCNGRAGAAERVRPACERVGGGRGRGVDMIAPIREELAARFEGDSLLLKTFVLEAHAPQGAPALLEQVVADEGVVSRTSDSFVQRVRVREDVEFFVDHLDGRYWSFHTWSPARSAHQFLRDAVGQRRDLDWTWLPSGHLLDFWRAGEPRYGRTEFSSERFKTDAGRLQLTVAGAEASQFLDYVKERYGRSVAFDHVGVRTRDAAFGSVDEVLDRSGRFVSRGDSFALHQALVQAVVGRYRRLVEAVEARALAWTAREEGGATLTGAPVLFRFGIPVPDLEAFAAALFSSREPFRLWGVPREIDEGVLSVDAVDLHVAERLRFELTDRWMRVHLYQGGCGNTVARLVTTLQHTLDADLTLGEPELQAAISPA